MTKKAIRTTAMSGSKAATTEGDAGDGTAAMDIRTLDRVSAVERAICGRRLLGAALEDAFRDRHGRKGVRPAGIEGDVRDHLGGLLLGEAVIHRSVEMVGHLPDLPRRDQRTHRDQTAVSRREVRA